MGSHFPFAFGGNMMFFGIYLYTGTNCWVDVGWGFNQTLLSIILAKQFPGKASFLSSFLITLWGARLSNYFIFVDNNNQVLI